MPKNIALRVTTILRVAHHLMADPLERLKRGLYSLRVSRVSMGRVKARPGGSWMAIAPPGRRRTDTPHVLSDPERQVLSAIKEHPAGISIEEISADTLLSPDVVVKAVALLIQHGYIHVREENTNEAELELAIA